MRGESIWKARGVRLDQRPVRVLRALIDYFSIILAFWTSYLLHVLVVQAGWLDQGLLDPQPYVNMGVGFGAIVLAVFWKIELYRERASVLNLAELKTAVKGILLSAALFFAVLFLFQLSNFSRFVVVGGFGTSLVYVILERRVMAALIRKVQITGRVERRNVLIYGSGKTGRLLMKKLLQSPLKACRVVGFIDDFVPRGSTVSCRVDQTTMEVFEARVLGRLRDLPVLAPEHAVDELLVTVSLINAERHHELLQLARETGVDVGVVPRFGEVRADQIEIEDLSAIPVLRPSSARARPLYSFGKRLFDLLGSSLLLLATAPAWIAAALAIRLESGRPILFRQQRIGYHGDAFWILKFRTMHASVDPYMHSPAGDNDPRITRVGRILRMGGFDELPQLLNVVRGEMSLVGPRPEMPFIAEKYSALERQRLGVKPGITGIWQLSCDRHAEIHENLEYDLFYIRHQSLTLDLLILLETVFFTFSLLTKVGRQPSAVADGATVSRKPETVAGDLRNGYVLAALDQRRGQDVPESWLACAPAFYVLGSHSHVKILVAPDNIAAFDQLFERPPGAEESTGYATEYVPYTGRGELRALTLGARMVITDLDHVVQWAQEGRVDVLTVDGHGLRWLEPSTAGEAIISDLAEYLEIEGVHVTRNEAANPARTG